MKFPSGSSSPLFPFTISSSLLSNSISPCSTSSVSSSLTALLASISAIPSSSGPLFPTVSPYLSPEIIEILTQFCHHFQYYFMEFLSITFAPKRLLKRLLLAVCLQGTVYTILELEHIFQYLFKLCYAKGREILSLQKQLKQAKTYLQWKVIAEKLDKLQGYDKWREKEMSDFYDDKTLRKRIRDIRWMMTSNDLFNLMFRLRGGLARDAYGIQNEGLFTRALAGTKYLIEDYHNTVCQALDYICDTDQDEIPTDAKLAFFNETRHAFGRTALLLSGGAALGYYHSGLAEELLNHDLLPRVVSGASAGSLLVSMIGTRTDEELRKLPNQEYRKDYLMFEWQTGKSEAKDWFRNCFPSFLRTFADFLFGVFIEGKSPQKLDSNHLREVVIENTGLDTFQEAFDRTGRIINITVAPVNDFDPPRLLNYLTAPHVCIYSAALASCAIPGVFDNVPLIIKEPNGHLRPENEWTLGPSRPPLGLPAGAAEEAREGDQQQGQVKGQGQQQQEQQLQQQQLPPHHHHYSDGSVENDLPMKQLSELFNVNHFIVSQVNAHSAIFSTVTMERNAWHPPLFGLFVGLLKFLKTQARYWVSSVTDLLIDHTIFPSWGAKRGVSLLLTQDYGGRASDITIMPWRGHLNLITSWLVFLLNPSEEEYAEIVHKGKLNTWPYMARIRSHCQIEATLDQCVQRLRKRMVLENYRSLTANASAPSLYLPRSAAAAAYSQTAIEATAETVAIPVPVGQGVPSFYTSRSLLTLSGLSVSDPLPLTPEEMAREGIQTPHPRLTYASHATARASKENLSSQQEQVQADDDHWVDAVPLPVPAPAAEEKERTGRINRVPSGPLFPIQQTQTR